jgi:ectonucleotide pyrophosphatase/phosphodiesterase family protein 1/3
LLPPPIVDIRALHANISRALAPGGVQNGEFLSLYLKDDIPERFHYSKSPRIAPIVGIVAEGYTVRKTRAEKDGIQCGGVHGFDNALFSMRTIFFARGPRFGVRNVVPTFRNIELYEVMCDILGLEPAPNNGTAGFKETVLRRPC